MRKIGLSLLAAMVVVGASAQEKKKEYPKPEAMNPAMTEFWTPQPKIVTPGDIQTNSAPSDAIVLFDGSNLNAWTTDRGGEAGWTVHDGVFTVDTLAGLSGNLTMHVADREYTIRLTVVNSPTDIRDHRMKTAIDYLK